jgi:hypothetical protein
MSPITIGKPAAYAGRDEPTLASIWRAVAGIPLTDELLDWPPDTFALTYVLLERSQAYRFVLSPPCGEDWPPNRLPSWPDAVEEAGRRWSAWSDDRRGSVPNLLAEEWGVFRNGAGMPLEGLAQGNDWRMCEALLTLHAIADEACAGLGVALDSSNGEGCRYRARGRELLTRSGSLARISSHFVRVLPKVRTPPSGTSMSSLSRYACVQRPGVEVRWDKLPTRHPGTGPLADDANLLLLPWPLRIRQSDFRAIDDSVQRPGKEPFGFFNFAPSDKLDLDLVARILVAARDEVDSVDAVILPECALDESDIDDLETLLARHGVIMLVAGVRPGARRPGRFAHNSVHIGVNPKLEKGGPLADPAGEAWFHIRQNKHHRWLLDEAQIYQYHLGGALHPSVRWWEAMDVPRRSLQFIELGEGITLVSLVCEDLAQIDDVAETIRAVAPTGVVTLLLDGPQLSSRWSSRYASVLADDPGSSVLTLTSFGMAERSRPHGRDFSRVVGLWRDPERRAREISLEAGAHAVLLTTCGQRVPRRSADGRRPVDNVTSWFDVAVCQIRASTAASGPPKTKASLPTQPPLEVSEVTILTSFAQAVAEALAYAPDSVAELLPDADAGAAWRAEFGIPEPSARLAEAIRLIGAAIRAATPSGGTPTFDAALFAVRIKSPGELGLGRLARQVLHAALEQRHQRRFQESQ